MARSDASRLTRFRPSAQPAGFGARVPGGFGAMAPPRLREHRCRLRDADAPQATDRHQVLMVMRGHWRLSWDGGETVLSPGNTCAVPPGLRRRLAPARERQASIASPPPTIRPVRPRLGPGADVTNSASTDTPRREGRQMRGWSGVGGAGAGRGHCLTWGAVPPSGHAVGACTRERPTHRGCTRGTGGTICV